MNPFLTTYYGSLTTGYTNTLQQAATKDSISKENLLEITDAICTNNQKKFVALTSNYTIETLAKARFDWFAKPHNVKYENSNLFLVACTHGYKNFAEKLLFTDEVAIDERFSDRQRTPLMVAATRGQAEIVDFLLQSGADWKLTGVDNYRADQLTIGCCLQMFGIDKCMRIIDIFLQHARKTNEVSVLRQGQLSAEINGNEQLKIIYINNNKDFILLHRRYNINPTDEFEQLAMSAVNINEKTEFVAAHSTCQNVNTYISQLAKLPEKVCLDILSENLTAWLPGLKNINGKYQNLRKTNLLVNMFIGLVIGKQNGDVRSSLLLNDIAKIFQQLLSTKYKNVRVLDQS